MNCSIALWCAHRAHKQEADCGGSGPHFYKKLDTTFL